MAFLYLYVGVNLTLLLLCFKETAEMTMFQFHAWSIFHDNEIFFLLILADSM